MNIYVDLTQEFNDGMLRAVLSSGQAVVLHRPAVMNHEIVVERALDRLSFRLPAGGE